MRARVLLLPVLVLGACRAEAPAARTGAGAWASPGASPPAGPGDAIVATVDSRPVWGSCVAAQLARGGRSRRAALDECIDFELLAQAAEARGLGRAPDPELERARRAAMVGRLVETGFEDRYRTPADLGATLDRAVDALADQLDQPEFRASRCPPARRRRPRPRRARSPNGSRASSPARPDCSRPTSAPPPIGSPPARGSGSRTATSGPRRARRACRRTPRRCSRSPRSAGSPRRRAPSGGGTSSS